MKNYIQQLKKYYAIERVMAGAARALGVTAYRRDYGTHAYHEVQIDLILWTIFVTVPVSTTMTTI